MGTVVSHCIDFQCMEHLLRRNDFEIPILALLFHVHIDIRNFGYIEQFDQQHVPYNKSPLYYCGN